MCGGMCVRFETEEANTRLQYACDHMAALGQYDLEWEISVVSLSKFTCKGYCHPCIVC